MLKKQKETLRILLEQKKISYEIRIKIEEENIILKDKAISLENKLNDAKRKLKEIELKNKKKKFDELEFLYRKICKKTFYNNLYKVGTPEYKNCILNEDKKIR